VGKGEERREARGNDGALIGGRWENRHKEGRRGNTVYILRPKSQVCVCGDFRWSPENRQLADSCATEKGPGWVGTGRGGKGGHLEAAELPELGLLVDLDHLVEGDGEPQLMQDRDVDLRVRGGPGVLMPLWFH